MANLETTTSLLKKGEGRTNHLYKDINGYMTIGIGCQLSLEQAKSLPFIYAYGPKKGEKATAAEIEAEYQAVKMLPHGQGYKAEWYQGETGNHAKLAIDDPFPPYNNTIDILFEKRLNTIKAELRSKYPKFDTYPAKIQAAMLDMAFNVGATGLKTKFPNFNKAIDKPQPDWVQAAKESHRGQINAERNNNVRQLFLEVAGVPIPPPTSVKQSKPKVRKHPKEGPPSKPLSSHHNQPVKPLSGASPSNYSSIGVVTKAISIPPNPNDVVGTIGIRFGDGSYSEGPVLRSDYRGDDYRPPQ